MKFFLDWPIKRKLTAITMFASGLVLTLASITLVTNDLMISKQNLVGEMYALAEVLGDNSTSALTFDDDKTAAATLSSVSRHPHISAAAIFDRNRRLFATYQNPTAPTDATVLLQSAPGHTETAFHGDYLDIVSPIILNGEHIGWVTIRSNLDALDRQLHQSLTIALALLGIAGVLAYAVASKLQHIISAPIHALAHTMGQVSAHKDYSLRVPLQETQDEMGRLTRGFNEMLHAIQDRDDILTRYREQLEQEVNKQTAELSNSLHTVKEQRHFLTSMVESLPIMVFVKDSRDLKLIQWNQASERLTGFSRDEILGTYGSDVFSIDGTNAFLDEERDVLAGGTLLELHEKSIHTKERGLRTLHMKQLPILDDRHKPKYLLGIAEDITDRKQAEEALRTSELRLSLTVKGSQIGIWDWNLITNTVYFSPEWKNQLGHTDNEVSNTFQEWESRVHPDDLPRSLTAIDDYLNQRSENYEFEHRLRHKDGTYRWILTRGALFSDPETLSKRMVGIHIDLTEQKNVQETLRIAKEHAEAANVAKSQFLANMSHEIRTPMNGVLGMTELLLATALTDKQHRMAVTVQQSAHSLLTIINDILDFSKIEAGKLQLDCADFALHALFDDTMGLLGESARRKGLELSYFVPPTLPAIVRGDPTRLRQILTNLVGNAIKFTPQGSVTVAVHCLNRTDSQVSLKVSIADTGVGVAPEAHNRIFDAFAQADGSTSRQYGGTGLGLTIVKQLVQLMGGTIGLESSPGAGSTFWVTLTLDYPQDQSLPSPSQILNGTAVLAVDDNETNRHILQEYLTAWGMRPDVVASGEEALRLLCPPQGTPRAYALGLFDIHMPGMDGLMLAERIRHIPSCAALPLVALSSTDCTEAGVPLTESGFACALRKPMQPALLRQCLERVLARTAQTTPDARSNATAAQRPHFMGTPHILLVEDNPVNRDVGLAMLDLLGCRADTAVNGRDAVEAVHRTSFDLILMDCQMPVLNGFDATGEIRRWEYRLEPPRHTPIIALTANAMQGDRERCRAAGMDDYLAKPFSSEQLGDLLTQWLAPAVAEVSAAHTTVPPASELAGASAPPAGTPHTLEPAPAPKPTPAEALVDVTAWAPITAMNRPGRPNLLTKVLTAYLADAPPLLHRIREAIAIQDASDLTAAAHRLKSSSATLGAMTVAALCEQLERCGRTEQIENARPLLPRLEQDFDAVCAIFHRELTTEHAA